MFFALSIFTLWLLASSPTKKALNFDSHPEVQKPAKVTEVSLNHEIVNHGSHSHTWCLKLESSITHFQTSTVHCSVEH